MNNINKVNQPFHVFFCKGSHFNDNCDKCATLNDCKQQLSLQGQCFIRMSKGHLFKNCDSYKKCYYRKRAGHHNRCICPKQFARSSEAPTSDQSFVTNVDQCSDKDHIKNNTATDTSLTISAETDRPSGDSDHMLLASGERVPLQTALAPVCCGDGSVISARILLDSASRRTFMTNQMAKLLRLPSQRKETLSVCTFGSRGPQNIETYVVHFNIITKDGTQLNLQANVLSHITSPIQRGPLQQLDLEFLQLISLTRLADVVPKSSEMASIDILVGSDSFWSIVSSGSIVLPSGLFFYPPSWDIYLWENFQITTVILNLIIIS